MAKLLKCLFILTIVSWGQAFASSRECSDVFLSLANAKKMMALRGTETDKLFVDLTHHIRIRTGIPSTLKLVSPDGKVFRHYTSEQGLQKILQSLVLEAGCGSGSLKVVHFWLFEGSQEGWRVAAFI
jgi:hypothetical protein